MLPFKILMTEKFPEFRGNCILSPRFVVHSRTNNAILCGGQSVSVLRSIDKHFVYCCPQTIIIGSTVWQKPQCCVCFFGHFNVDTVLLWAFTSEKHPQIRNWIPDVDGVRICNKFCS